MLRVESVFELIMCAKVPSPPPRCPHQCEVQLLPLGKADKAKLWEAVTHSGDPSPPPRAGPGSLAEPVADLAAGPSAKPKSGDSGPGAADPAPVLVPASPKRTSSRDLGPPVSPAVGSPMAGPVVARGPAMAAFGLESPKK